MQYVSTRGKAKPVSFEQAVLQGLARDGGLLVPESYPVLLREDWRALGGLPFDQIAARMIQPFVSDCLSPEELARITSEARREFDHPQVAPVVELDDDLWLMKLFHGPTLAFKDIAMQVLGRLFDHVLAKRGGRMTVIGATSGDTGSAAIEAIRGREHASIFILHPHGRTSTVQRRQMTTVDAPNVFNIAIEGTFDDCQDLIKAMFNDHAFRDRVCMSGVNSINWARILPQAVYYATASLELGGPDQRVSFAVPTGNFGDVFAGYLTYMMGLPIGRLIVASNLNDILTRALTTGQHELSAVEPTMSPSMDIQVSSNFERLLFDLFDRDSERMAKLMQQLADDRRFELGEVVLAKARRVFDAYRVDEQQTLETIAQVHRETGMLIDPHTAVGVHAARQYRQSQAGRGDTTREPMVALATAHPAKFPDAVEKATGIRPPLPEHLADLYDRSERFDVLPAEFDVVKKHMIERLKANQLMP